MTTRAVPVVAVSMVRAALDFNLHPLLGDSGIRVAIGLNLGLTAEVEVLVGSELSPMGAPDVQPTSLAVLELMPHLLPVDMAMFHSFLMHFQQLLPILEMVDGEVATPGSRSGKWAKLESSVFVTSFNNA